MVELLWRTGEPLPAGEGAPVGGALWIAVYQSSRRWRSCCWITERIRTPRPNRAARAISHTRKDPELRNLLLWYGAREETNERKELENLIGDNALEEVEKLLQPRRNWGWNRWRFGEKAYSPDRPTAGAAR